MTTKSTVEEIRQRFDVDVERFSNLDTGQVAAVDAQETMSVVTEAAAAICPRATSVLDLGCGAGNYTLKLIESLHRRNATQNANAGKATINVSLLDLSQPMLDRARERVGAATTGQIETHQHDLRDFVFGEARYDIVLAAMVLHHLRDESQWRDIFTRVFRSIRPGGCFVVADLVRHESPAVQQVMWSRYGDYLAAQKDETYRDEVLRYIEKEDTPAPLSWQLAVLRDSGFADVDVLHKRSCFAAFTGIRAVEV